MYLRFDDGFLDYDLDLLRDSFAVLDRELGDLQKSIDKCLDPDQMGLLDEVEHRAGSAFVACQRYIAATYGPTSLTKKSALGLGPHHIGGETFARILNAAANYAKHVNEWDRRATRARDRGALKGMQMETIRIIESVTPWSDYTCTNVLFEITSPVGHCSDVIPKLEAWREELDDASCE